MVGKTSEKSIYRIECSPEPEKEDEVCDERDDRE